jgi:integrase/recombinase XerD
VGKEGACHIFRHTCATLMLERGADIRFIQQMLGHEHLTTTEIYTRVSIGKLQEVHARTHPSARLGRAGGGEADPPPGEDPAEELLAALAEEEAEERDIGGGVGDEEDG